MRKNCSITIAVLSDPLDKRDALKRDELVKAIMKSDKTYDEVIAFLANTEVGQKNSRRNSNGKRSKKTKKGQSCVK